MGIKWLQKLTESPEQKTAREAAERLEQIEALKKTSEFRDVMVDAFNQLKADEEQKEKDEIRKHADNITKAKLDIDLVGESMQDSPEPFANVLAMGFSKEHGIQVKIDFNPAFVRYLNTFGIVGNNDEETIRIWLAHMADDIMNTERAEDYLYNGVDKSEKPSMSYEEMFKMDEDDNEDDDSGWEQPPL
jgi:hypothetical protein